MRCPGCGDRVPKTRYGEAVQSPCCTQACAEGVLTRLEAESKLTGNDWRDRLPADQRPDLIPWDAWQAATRLHGKKQWRKNER